MLFDTSGNSMNTMAQIQELYDREYLVRRLMGIKENTITRTHRVIKNLLLIAMLATGLVVVMAKSNISSIVYLTMLILVAMEGYYAVEQVR
jgi:hypothetical protein